MGHHFDTDCQQAISKHGQSGLADQQDTPRPIALTLLTQEYVYMIANGHWLRAGAGVMSAWQGKYIPEPKPYLTLQRH